MRAMIRRRNQSPGVWYRGDVLDILRSVHSANWDIAQHIDTPQMRLYRKGFEAAIEAAATAFGLSYTPPTFPDDPAAPVASENRAASFTVIDVDVLTPGSDNDVCVGVIG